MAALLAASTFVLVGCTAPPSNPPENFGVPCVDDSDCQEPDPEHADLACVKDVSEEADGGMTLRCGLPCETDDDCPYQSNRCHWMTSSVCQDGYEESICKPALVHCG